MVVLAALLGGLVLPGQASAVSLGSGVQAPLPANAGSNPDVSVNSVSCPSAGNCTAVGRYDASSSTQGLLLTETSGTWATGVEAPLPANAGSSQLVYLNSVSCASVGNCTAVGYYHDSSNEVQGLLLTETAGAWATGVEASLPANAGPYPQVFLNSVSCSSAGNCTAVGRYDDSSTTQGLLLTETAGAWATGVEAPLPANATSTNQSVFLNSVSCASAGNCTAVGTYYDSSTSQGLLLTEASGTWVGVEAPLPANARSSPQVSLSSVSCASAGNCTAVGSYYDDSSPNEGLLLTETAGTWAGVEAPLPANASSTNQVVYLNSVSCASAGNCTAVGTYRDSSATQGLLLTEASGAWATGVEALPGSAGYSQGDYLDSVSCASGGNCTAVGAMGLVLTQTSGTWATEVEAPLPANAGSFGFLESVACASANDCTAVGSYNDSSGNTQGLLLGSPASPPVLITAAPAGDVSSGAASFEFASTDSSAEFQCQLDGGAWTSCSDPQSYSGLSDGSHSFHVRVGDSGSPEGASWKVDTRPPDTSIVSGPSGTTSDSSALFKFTSSDGGVEFSCQLDGGAWQACSSQEWAADGLVPGAHTFNVRSTDAAGNTDPVGASRTWTVGAATCPFSGFARDAALGSGCVPDPPTCPKPTLAQVPTFGPFVVVALTRGACFVRKPGIGWLSTGPVSLDGIKVTSTGPIVAVPPGFPGVRADGQSSVYSHGKVHVDWGNGVSMPWPSGVPFDFHQLHNDVLSLSLHAGLTLFGVGVYLTKLELHSGSKAFGNGNGGGAEAHFELTLPNYVRKISSGGKQSPASVEVEFLTSIGSGTQTKITGVAPLISLGEFLRIENTRLMYDSYTHAVSIQATLATTEATPGATLGGGWAGGKFPKGFPTLTVGAVRIPIGPVGSGFTLQNWQASIAANTNYNSTGWVTNPTLKGEAEIDWDPPVKPAWLGKMHGLKIQGSIAKTAGSFEVGWPVGYDQNGGAGSAPGYITVDGAANLFDFKILSGGLTWWFSGGPPGGPQAGDVKLVGQLALGLGGTGLYLTIPQSSSANFTRAGGWNIHARGYLGLGSQQLGVSTHITNQGVTICYLQGKDPFGNAGYDFDWASKTLVGLQANCTA